MGKVVEQLKAVRAKLEQGWCQGALARNEGGQKVDTSSPYACAWCLEGAAKVVGGNFSSTYCALNDEVLCRGFAAVYLCNDTPGRTKDEVLALVDKAIAKAESEGQ